MTALIDGRKNYTFDRLQNNCFNVSERKILNKNLFWAKSLDEINGQTYQTK